MVIMFLVLPGLFAISAIGYKAIIIGKLIPWLDFCFVRH